jgi:hypothetical protein
MLRRRALTRCKCLKMIGQQSEMRENINDNSELQNERFECWSGFKSFHLRKHLSQKKLKDASRNLLCWGLMLVPFAICAIVGLTGILFFYNLRLQISVFPDCDSAESMMTALYACCAFWLTDACLFLIWSFTAFNQDSWNVRDSSSFCCVFELMKWF